MVPPSTPWLYIWVFNMETLVVGPPFNRKLLSQGSIGARDQSTIHVHDEVRRPMYSELRRGARSETEHFPCLKSPILGWW